MSKRPCSRRPAACGSLPSYPPRRAAGSAGWTTTKRMTGMPPRPVATSTSAGRPSTGWWRRYDPRRLRSLEDDRRPRRPRRVRQPETPPALEARIRVLRETHPRWGDRKLAVLLHGDGWIVSHATVGRVLGRLRAKGQLHEPPVVRAALHKKRRKAQLARRYARRKRWGYLPRDPGDLVQIDTTPITLYPGCQRVHMTARDVVSPKEVVAAHGRSHPGAADRWRLRVQGELRAGLPGAGDPAVRPAAAKSAAERTCGAGAPDAFQEEFYDLVDGPPTWSCTTPCCASTRRCTMASGRTRPWGTSPRTRSWPVARLIIGERRQSVSDLLRQYISLTRSRALPIMKDG